jgi:hypothetical protein
MTRGQTRTERESVYIMDVWSKQVRTPDTRSPRQASRNYIQWMKDHALIGKFMGIWPSERALQIWIKSHWKVKGKIDLQLGSKGFLQSYSSKQETETKF